MPQPTDKQTRKKPSVPAFRRSIIYDAFNPKDLRELNVIFCCEQCSYYDSKEKTCAMGFRTDIHRRDQQLKMYSLTGKMALCRSQEID